MNKYFLSLVWVFALAFSGTSKANVIYDIQNGALIGASGININGELYSVTFGDSCASMFGGCNSALFDFTTQQGAVAALNALFEQVLVDNVSVGGIVYNFDTHPELVQSCDLVGVAFCEIWVPYQVSNGLVTSAWHVNTGTDDHVGSNDWSGPITYGDGMPYMAFTNFEKVAASVPEPGSLALLGIGIAGLGLIRRKQKLA